MHQQSHGRCYSEFFTSGFRAMTERCPTRHTSAYDSSPPSLMRRHNPRRISSWPSSIVPSVRSSRTSESPSRRSSILSFPGSRKFGCRKVSLPKNSLTFSTLPQNNTRGVDGDAGITDVWITAGGPYTPCRISKYSDENYPPYIDPFASSPNSKSFFTDVPGSPAPRSRKRESFLSLTSGHAFTLPSLLRRDRPTSIQTVPSQPPSWCSPDCRPLSWVRSDRSFASDEEEPANIVLVGDGGCLNEPVEDTDWRQFHIELLREEAA